MRRRTGFHEDVMLTCAIVQVIGSYKRRSCSVRTLGAVGFAGKILIMPMPAGVAHGLSS